MKKIFADTFYWIALLNKKDAWHERAMNMSQKFDKSLVYTTDEVLIEFLSFFKNHGRYLRAKAVEAVYDILENPFIQVIPQSRKSFQDGISLYNQRLDKEYSLQDCISMQSMKREKIHEVLSNDEHFTQEGLIALFRQSQ